MPPVVRFYLDGNALRVTPASPMVIRQANEHLSYTRKKFLSTKAERERAGSHITFQDIRCFSTSHVLGEPCIVTNAGYYVRFYVALKRAGFTVHVEDLSPEEKGPYVPNWKALDDVDFRYKQKETLQKMLTTQRGRIWWATGTGKSWLVPCLCRLFPKARIVYTTKHISVLETTFNRLDARLPSVGIHNGKVKKNGRRVMCYSAGCLLHAADDFKPHILVADEVHELATDVMFQRFNKFRYCRMYSLSANDGDRFDSADFELEGIFGPVISELSYPEAEKHGMVVPIHVHWVAAKMEKDPAEGCEGVPLLRWGIWRNKYRNGLIAQAARQFQDDQVLITCKTLDHACHLKQLLPEFELCYAPTELNSESLDMYKNWGLIPRDEAMTTGRMRWMRGRFETGKMKKVIATTVWNRGVNFEGLPVLIRADASSSRIDDTQIPGRLSRTKLGKPHGVLIDFTDEFNNNLFNRRENRRRDYAKKKWIQHFPDEDDDEGMNPLQRLAASRARRKK